jgi:tripartite-type tricarboxylate transporter receptor subunit TctC
LNPQPRNCQRKADDVRGGDKVRTIVSMLLACVAAFGAPFATAQEPYPSKPIRIIVVFGPGSSTDIVARLVGQKLSESVGQPVIIENKPGAAGILGIEQAAKSRADGYTLVTAASSGFGIQPSLYRKLPYDVIRDFAPITNLVTVEQTLVVPKDGPQTVSAVVDDARARPNAVAYGSLGSGSTSHLIMQMFASAAGISLIHVPFKGSSEASAQLLGGTVPMMFDAMPAVLANVRNGRLKALAISSAKRSPFLPEVPTLAESGYPSVDALGWIGIAAPAETPTPVLDRLNHEIVAILGQPDVKARLDQMGFVPVGNSREEFGRFMKAEIAKWGKAVQDSGAKAD